jgi:hypothetical protein
MIMEFAMFTNSTAEVSVIATNVRLIMEFVMFTNSTAEVSVIASNVRTIMEFAMFTNSTAEASVGCLETPAGVLIMLQLFYRLTDIKDLCSRSK